VLDTAGRHIFKNCLLLPRDRQETRSRDHDRLLLIPILRPVHADKRPLSAPCDDPGLTTVICPFPPLCSKIYRSGPWALPFDASTACLAGFRFSFGFLTSLPVQAGYRTQPNNSPNLPLALGIGPGFSAPEGYGVSRGLVQHFGKGGT
jgi:hypothetical protein